MMNRQPFLGGSSRMRDFLSWGADGSAAEALDHQVHTSSKCGQSKTQKIKQTIEIIIFPVERRQSGVTGISSCGPQSQ